jgi:hypothetical protein
MNICYACITPVDTILVFEMMWGFFFWVALFCLGRMGEDFSLIFLAWNL